MTTQQGATPPGGDGPAGQERRQAREDLRWSEAERKQAEAALRESEERLRVLTDNLPHVMFYQLIGEPDGRHRFAYVSASVAALHEVSAEAVLADEAVLYGQINPDCLPALLAAETESMSTLGLFRIETMFRLPSGRVRWAELASTPRRLADGRIAWDGVEVDITARKKAEKERLDLERQMLHAQKLESLGVMAGGIAHDFNNLLMGVLGNLELAALHLGPESDVQPLLAQATLAANRAADLTRQILAYSGRGRFVIKPLNLSDLVLENVHMLKTVISKRVELDVRPAPDLPAIQADPGQIQQVVMNLITNAAEAIGPGDGVVRVTTGAGYCDAHVLSRNRAEETPAPGRFVWLEVADDGCGMDAGTQQRLFDPFFTTKFTGRGLGLAAVLGIVRGHRGAILLESAPGRGSTFRVLFPAAPSE